MPGGPRVRRKRGPRTAVERSASTIIREHDIDLAQTVCQVVNELVCQVADEPYGEMLRKRPPFGLVIRKFIKDSVQDYEDHTVQEIIQTYTKRKKGASVVEDRDVPPLPYGIDLVMGLLLEEIELLDKRDRARINIIQKSARQREHRQALIQAIPDFFEMDWDNESMRTASSDDEWRPSDPAPHDSPLSSNSSEDLVHSNGFVARGKTMPDLSAAPSCSPRSEDSDWATVQPSARVQWLHQPPRLSAPLSLGNIAPSFPMRQLTLHDFVPCNRRGSTLNGRGGGGRGRGRGKTATLHTIRSILENSLAPPTVPAPPMHPMVKLAPPGFFTPATVHPQYHDFLGFSSSVGAETQQQQQPAKRGGAGRGRPRGRGSRGGRGAAAASRAHPLSTPADWDADAEELQRLADCIETSGDSAATQESQEDMVRTIDEVVARVNGMSELDEKKGYGLRREKKKEEEEPKTAAKRRSGSRVEDEKEAKKGRFEEVVLDLSSESSQEIVKEEEKKRVRGPGKKTIARKDFDEWVAHTSTVVVTSSDDDDKTGGGNCRPVIRVRRVDPARDATVDDKDRRRSGSSTMRESAMIISSGEDSDVLLS